MNNYKNFYFIGIGGIGMSALARYFKSLGKNVLGYDKTETKLTSKLQEEDIKITFDDQITEDVSTLKKEETLVIYTPAIKQLDILEYFKNQGFEVLKIPNVLLWQELTEKQQLPVLWHTFVRKQICHFRDS